MSLKRDSPNPKSILKKAALSPLPNSPHIRIPSEESGLYEGSRKPSVSSRTDGHPLIPPALGLAKNKSSKFALNSMLKPGQLDPKALSPQLLSPKTGATTIMSAKNRVNASEFMLQFYKAPSEKSEVFTKSFVSFRELATIHAQQDGGEPDEMFQPSHHSNMWKSQLHFNKKQEGMFRQTIQDVFRQSQDSFNKLVKDNEKRKNIMPHVKVYHNLQDMKNEQTKSTTSEADQPEPTLNKTYNKPGQKLMEYAARIRIGNDPYKFYEYPPSDSIQRLPNVREGATLTVVGSNIYLYGGVSKELHSEIEMLNPVTFTWEKIPQKGDIPPFGRLGHSADLYQNNSFIVFGGEKNYNATLNIRDCLNDARIFTPETNEWKYLKCYGEHIEARRNHSGTVVGKHLVVFGGIDSNGNYLNDLKILDLVTNRWGSVEETGKDAHALAFHRACLVLYSVRKDINLFKLPELKIDESAQKIAEEGIYFFGGKTDGEETTNALRILKIGSVPFKWISPVTEGKPPEPRYAHVMIHCKKLNMLVVHGGRCDNLYSKQSTPYLADFHILQLEDLTWVSVILKGVQPSPRCSHTAAVMGTKMMIFGGIYFGIYCPPEPKVVQMDPMLVAKLEINKRDSNKSVEILNVPQKPDQILMDYTATAKKYDNVVSFLPMPKKKKLRKLKSMAKPEPVKYDGQEY